MIVDTAHNLTASGAIAHHVLLVEDDAQTAQAIKSVLEKNGYEVIIAKDGGQAQSAFVMRKPDFVILDLILPGESGFEVCQRIKQTNETVPVMVVTAIDMQDSRDLCSRIGADGYLTKPLTPDTLLERIPQIAQEVWERNHGVTPKEERRIRFNCRCGKRFKVSSVHKGRTLTCPDCGEPLIVPRHD